MLFYLLLHHGTVVAINVNWVDEFQGLKHSLKEFYRKVTSPRLSWLVEHSRIFRLFMKGKFDAYDLWPKEFKIGG